MPSPSPAQIAAAAAAVRKMLDDYSSFDSSLVSDDLLHQVVQAALTAALAVK